MSSADEPLPPLVTATPRSTPGGAVRCACGTVFETGDKADMPEILEAYQEHLPWCTAKGSSRSAMGQVAEAIFSVPTAIMFGVAALVLIKIYG